MHPKYKHKQIKIAIQHQQSASTKQLLLYQNVFQESYDFYKTPSSVGSLGNYVLGRGDFRRTRNPIYSFAVIGKDQNNSTVINLAKSVKNETRLWRAELKDKKVEFEEVQHVQHHDRAP